MAALALKKGVLQAVPDLVQTAEAMLQAHHDEQYRTRASGMADVERLSR